jgi:hypothetical protein
MIWQTARSVSLSAFARLVSTSARRKSAQLTGRMGVATRQRVLLKKRRESRKSSPPGKRKRASRRQ